MRGHFILKARCAHIHLLLSKARSCKHGALQWLNKDHTPANLRATCLCSNVKGCLQILVQHLHMLLDTFAASVLASQMYCITCELLRSWCITSACSEHAEKWLHDLVKSECEGACCQNAKAGEELLARAKVLLEARFYSRASNMMETAQVVNPRSTSFLCRALQGRMLLSTAIAAASSDTSSAACQIRQAMDLFQGSPLSCLDTSRWLMWNAWLALSMRMAALKDKTSQMHL